MRRAVVVLGTTAAGLAALFSYKTHVAGIADASTSPATPTMTAPMTSPAASPSARATPSRSAAKKSTPKPSSSATAPRTTSGTTPTATRSATPAPSKKPATAAQSSSAPAGKSGTFSGQPVNTQYGEVQVSITVSNGKVTNANGSLPQGGDSIAQNALPQLNQEVLTVQSANIQAVSGATEIGRAHV